MVKSRQYAEFVDPAHPEQGLIRWEGNWRELKGEYTFYLNWENFRYLWEFVKFPLLTKNTLIIAFITEIGVLASSITGLEGAPVQQVSLPLAVRRQPAMPSR